MLTDDTNNLLVVRLDGAPPDVFGLVPRLEQDVGKMAVLLRHLAKERLGLIGMAVAGLQVPINDNVDAEINRCLHDRLEFAFLSARVVEIAALVNAHGGTDDFNVPILH